MSIFSLESWCPGAESLPCKLKIQFSRVCLILSYSLSYYEALTSLEPFLLGYN